MTNTSEKARVLKVTITTTDGSVDSDGNPTIEQYEIDFPTDNSEPVPVSALFFTESAAVNILGSFYNAKPIREKIQANSGLLEFNDRNTKNQILEHDEYNSVTIGKHWENMVELGNIAPVVTKNPGCRIDRISKFKVT